MIRYEVVLELDPRQAGAVAQYLRDTHIPEIYATGCFVRIRLDRASPTRFRATYHARRVQELDHYFQAHAPRLRADFLDRFPAGVTIGRETWTEIATWE